VLLSTIFCLFLYDEVILQPFGCVWSFYYIYKSVYLFLCYFFSIFAIICGND